MAVLGFNTEEGERASGSVGPNGRMGRTKLGWWGRKDGLGFKRVWATWKIEKLLEFLFSSFEFETKVKIQIKYIFLIQTSVNTFQKQRFETFESK
jgi:hypothetical protein